MCAFTSTLSRAQPLQAAQPAQEVTKRWVHKTRSECLSHACEAGQESAKALEGTPHAQRLMQLAHGTTIVVVGGRIGGGGVHRVEVQHMLPA
jgi:hypothetical protein